MEAAEDLRALLALAQKNENQEAVQGMPEQCQPLLRSATLQLAHLFLESEDDPLCKTFEAEAGEPLQSVAEKESFTSWCSELARTGELQQALAKLGGKGGAAF